MRPWWERKLEEAAAFVLKHEKLMRVVAKTMRLAQWPFVHDGVLNLPRPFNPTGERKLPGLARRSFREMWQSGELEEKR